MATCIKEGSRVIIQTIPKGWFLDGMLSVGQMDTVIEVRKSADHGGKKVVKLASQWNIPVECLKKVI